MLREPFEEFIIKYLFADDGYFKLISPYLDPKYVKDQVTKTVFSKVDQYVSKYKTKPGMNEIFSDILKDRELPDEVRESTLSNLQTIRDTNYDIASPLWLRDETESHFKKVLLYDAIILAADILNDKKKAGLINSIPEVTKTALAFSFDSTIGREYGKDSTIHQQYEYYHRPDNRYTFPDWKFFNERVTAGGVSKKKLNLGIAGTNVGKTTLLVNITLQHQKSGENVLYLTGEDGEERITERIDGNILNIDTNRLVELNETNYAQGIKDIINKTKGRVIIKEFAAKKLSCRGIEKILEDLKLKENFCPDVVCIDYLTLLKSDMFTHITNSNSYYTSVAEELRGLATEKNIVLWSMLQFNRCLEENTKIEIEDIGIISIKEAIVGQKISTMAGYKKISAIYKQKQKCFKIKLDNGKEIICSANHLFPTNGEILSINTGLAVGMELLVK